MENTLRGLLRRAKSRLKAILSLSSKNSLSIGYATVKDLPIFNFFEFFETNELRFLTKKGTPKIEYYYQIMDSFNKEIGFSKTYNDEIKDKKRLLKLHISYLKTQDRNILNDIMELELEIFTEKSVNPAKIDDSIPYVFEKIGYCDLRQISTYEYYKILEHLKK